MWTFTAFCVRGVTARSTRSIAVRVFVKDPNILNACIGSSAVDSRSLNASTVMLVMYLSNGYHSFDEGGIRPGGLPGKGLAKSREAKLCHVSKVSCGWKVYLRHVNLSWSDRHQRTRGMD